MARLEEELATLKAHAQTAPVVTLINAGRVTEARQLVDLLQKASPSPALESWARVLAPPVVHQGTTATGSPLTQNKAWMREHAREYAGKWVALRDGTLVDADENRAALHRRLEQRGGLEGIILARL